MLGSYEIGIKVTILTNSDYHGQYSGLRGTIENFYRAKCGLLYGVKLDGKTNPNSSKGLFWFKYASLKVVEDENIEEKESEEFNMMPMFKEQFTAVHCTFLDNPNGPIYSFAMYDNLGIIPGDTVVVHTANHGISLATVHSIDEPNGSSSVKSGREIICKVDMESYKKRVATREEAKKLLKKMNDVAAGLSQIMFFETLAAKSPEMQSLLTQYKNVVGIPEESSTEEESPAAE